MKLILSEIDMEPRLALVIDLAGHWTTTSPRYAACPDSRNLERPKAPSILSN